MRTWRAAHLARRRRATGLGGAVREQHVPRAPADLLVASGPGRRLPRYVHRLGLLLGVLVFHLGLWRIDEGIALGYVAVPANRAKQGVIYFMMVGRNSLAVFGQSVSNEKRA